MSIVEINKYYKKLAQTIRFGGSTNEMAIRTDFINLINYYAEKNHLMLIPELAVLGTNGKKVYPDGTLKNSFSFNFGYWESKDLDDDIEDEIYKKISTGYPITNTLFENSKIAILYQDNNEVLRVETNNPIDLDVILSKFINYAPKQIADFDQALSKFKEDIPIIVADLRNILDNETINNKEFIKMQDSFLNVCQKELNPDITKEDIREIIIQHILTYEIFSSIFNNQAFHNRNNISQKVEQLISIALPSNLRKSLLSTINSYYMTIKESASNIVGHDEKQQFLKIFYEEFYKVYNPAAADKLGVVYTPNEIVDFMINFTNEVMLKYFQKNLYDKNINILDPATGTGTFLVDLIEYIPKTHLQHKYKHEMFANEVSILPYYIANLNIEYTFYEKMGYQEEFPNICFVDTIDNTAPISFSGQQELDLETLSVENSERIARQNSNKISVIIGNPPYNANQQNFNDFNKNRKYPMIDSRIKSSFVKESSAQKTKVYDMYTRFYRWAMDRIDDKGVISFITNRSFIDASSYDGFRKCIEKDFDYAYVIDTKSDVRKNSKITGTTHNVFGIQTGVAIMFLIKNTDNNEKCKINYYSLSDEMLKNEKLEWLKNNTYESIDFMQIKPDKKDNWLNTVNNDFDTLIPLYSKGKDSIFNFSSLGVSTNRNDWVTDFSIQTLQKKAKYLSETYNKSVKNKKLDTSIKWSRDLEKKFKRGLFSNYSQSYILNMEYRPFTTIHYYSEKIFSDILTQNHYHIFGDTLSNDNFVINCSGKKHTKGFSTIATDKISNLDFIEKTALFPLYTYTNENEKIDNISDWALNLFQTHYKDKELKKEDIFNYVYAVLHSTLYKDEYQINLSQELPKIPLYKDFSELSKKGKELLFLHINYNDAPLYNLSVVDELSKANKKQKYMLFEDNVKGLMNDSYGEIKVVLRADKKVNKIYIDKQITLVNIPQKAWEYKIANRSALEWVLDQNKFKKSKSEYINEHLNDYNFYNKRELVIELIKKVCTISVETLSIIEDIDNIIMGI